MESTHRPRLLQWFGLPSLAVLVCSPLTQVQATQLTFAFEAEVSQVIGDDVGMFDTISPGDEIIGTFTYDDFELPAGVHFGAFTINVGPSLFSASQYNWLWSDDGSGIMGSEGDSVILYCPGGTQSGSCELAPIHGTELGWNGSLSFGGHESIFEVPPTSQILAPAAALRLPETWNLFDKRELVIAIQRISGVGSQAILRGSIERVTLVPEPRAGVIMLSSAVLCVARRRPHFMPS